jgi:molybdopterin synthase catalytic subunit/uncharacterized membrane protein
MDADILYLGDTTLETAAGYLAGVLAHAGMTFEYVPSDRALTPDDLGSPRSLYIISDYPATNVSEDLQRRIVEQVRAGSGLLMIGGWESFQGCGGGWRGSPIAETLPVEIAECDDRQNCDGPVFVASSRFVTSHPILSGLPFNERPPLIGGYNRVTAKPDAQVLLTADRFEAERQGTEYRLTPSTSDPLLVVGEYGQGRVAALMTDLAPHWVGPLVDWGRERITAQAPGAEEIEVGDLYARFVRQLIEWTGSASSAKQASQTESPAERLVELTEAPIDASALLSFVNSAASGAVVLFLGTVRELTAGRRTVALDYDAYPEMALSKMHELVTEACARWPVEKVAVVHRLGHLKLGEASVAVAVSCPHRREAFETGRYLIDELKVRVPVWKKENWDDGSTEWVHPGIG